MWAHDLKLGRAREHLKELEAEVKRWVHEDGYSIRVYPDPEPPSYVVRAENIRPPGDALALLVGDCLYNARASLEYLAHALGDIGAGGDMTAEQSERSAFPIIGDRDREGFTGRGPDLFEGAAGRHLSTVDPEARAAIKRLQPFYEGDTWEFNGLWFLNELARLDRHRFPHFGAVRTENVELDRTRSRNIKIKEIETFRGAIAPDLEDSADLARVTAYPANPNEKMHMHFINGLAITLSTRDTFPIVHGDEVEWVIWRAVSEADDTIRELRRFLREPD